VDKRNESLSPMQALALLNNGFMLAMAKDFADALSTQGNDLRGEIETAFESALQRRPAESESVRLLAFAEANGLANACRLIFNLNEFQFVD
jgi:hypothetical protein